MNDKLKILAYVPDEFLLVFRWILSGIIQALFIALWVLVQWSVNKYTERASSVVFNPFDSKLLASGSVDGTIIIWDPYSGERQRTLRDKRPYEGMNIFGVTGLNEVQKETLKILGAIERPEGEFATS